MRLLKRLTVVAIICTTLVVGLVYYSLNAARTDFFDDVSTTTLSATSGSVTTLVSSTANVTNGNITTAVVNSLTATNGIIYELVSTTYGKLKGVYFASTSPTITSHSDASQVGSMAWCAAQIIGHPTITSGIIRLPAAAQNYTINSNYTLASTITLEIDHGVGKLAPADGISLTIGTNQIKAGNYQIFSGNGGFTFTGQQPLKSCWFPSLAVAVAKISTAQVELEINKSEALVASVIIPATTSITISRGAIITLGAHDLTVNNLKSAPAGAWINCNSTGRAYFSTGTVVHPEWWGIDGSGDEAEINFAIESCGVSKCAVSLSASTYTIGDSILARGGVSLIGAGSDSTVIDFSALTSGYAITPYTNTTQQTTGMAIRELALLGDGDTGGSAIGLIRTRYAIVDNVKITNAGDYGIHAVGTSIDIGAGCEPDSSVYIYGSHYSYINNVSILGTHSRGIFFDSTAGDCPANGVNRNTIVSSEIVGSTDYGLYLDTNANTNTFVAMSFGGSIDTFAYVNGSKNKFLGAYMDLPEGGACNYGLYLGINAEYTYYHGSLQNCATARVYNGMAGSARDNNFVVMDDSSQQQTYSRLRAIGDSDVQLKLVRGTLNSESYTRILGVGGTGDLLFRNLTDSASLLVLSDTLLTAAVELVMGQHYIEFQEMSSGPDAPGANKVRLYCVDSGGKTKLEARFPTGAVQQVAIEP